MVYWLATIKRLLAVYAVSGGYSVPRPREGSLGAIDPSSSGPAPARDIFERGQWWKNRVTSRVDPLADVRRCACGSCGECVSRAYEDQVSAFRRTVAAAGSSGVKTAPGEDRKEKGPAGPEDGKDKNGKNQDKGAGPVRPGEEDLDIAERLLVARLKVTDARVKRHEQAHLAAAGGLAHSGPHYEYRKGPDGKRYAVGGEVSIDVSREPDPEKTIRKMERVRAAALAPADPSPQDRRVAATADLVKLEAEVELRKEKAGEQAAMKKTEPAGTG